MLRKLMCTAALATVFVGAGGLGALGQNTPVTISANRSTDLQLTAGETDVTINTGVTMSGDIDGTTGAEDVTLKGAGTLTGDILLLAGNDELTISDTVTLTGQSTDLLMIDLGAGNDIMTFDSTVAVTFTQVKLGSGTNTFNVDESYGGGLTLAGGATDTIDVASAKEFTGSVTATASADTLTIQGAGTFKSDINLGALGDSLTFSGTVALAGTSSTDLLTFDLGAGDDTVTFGSTGAVTHTEIDLGDGDNTFNVNENYGGVLLWTGGATNEHTIAVASGKEFTGTATTTTLVDDLTIQGAGTFKSDISFGAGGDSLTFSGTVALAGTSADALTFDLGAGNDTVVFGSTTAVTYTEMNLGAGINTFTANENYAGSVTLAGGATDTISVAGDKEITGSVTGSSSDDILTISGGGTVKGDVDLAAGDDDLTISGNVVLAGTSTDTLTFGLGAGNDDVIFDSASNTAVSDTEIDLGAGTNTFTMRRSYAGGIVLGGGADTVTVIATREFTGSVTVYGSGDSGDDLTFGGAGTVKSGVDLAAGDDDLEFSGSVALTGTSSNMLTFALGAGDDDVIFGSTGAVTHAEITLGAGTNTFRAAESYSGPIVLAGGTDTVTVDTGKQLTGSITGSSSTEALTLQGAGTAKGTVSLGGGADSLTLGGSGTLIAGSSTSDRLSIELGAGDDTVSYTASRGATFTEIDAGASGSKTLTVVSNTAADDLVIKGSASIKGDINLGGGNDTLAISGSVALAGTSADPLTFDLGVGNDTVTFGSTGTVADTEIKLGAGTNTVTLNESYGGEIVLGGGATDTITVASSKEFTGGVTATTSVDTLTIGGAGSLKGDIDFGDGSDSLTISGTVAVAGTSADPLTFTMGEGDDTVTFGSSTAVADTAISLGAGTNTVNLNESYAGEIELAGGTDTVNLASGKEFTGTITQAAGTTAVTLTFGGTGGGSVKSDIDFGGGNDTLTVSGAAKLEGAADDDLLSLDLEAGNDTVNLRSTTAAAHTEIKLGGGTNTVNVEENYGQTIVLEGGTDTINVASGKEFTGTVEKSSGVDTLTLTGSGTVKSDIDLGEEGDTLTISGSVIFAGASATDMLTLSMGGGNDTVTFGSNSSVTHTEISLGDGTNTADLNESYAGGVVLDGGTDTVDVASGKEFTGSVSGGSSADDLTFEGAGTVRGSIRLGGGNDELEIGGTLKIGSSASDRLSLILEVGDNDVSYLGARGDAYSQIEVRGGSNTLTIAASDNADNLRITCVHVDGDQDQGIEGVTCASSGSLGGNIQLGGGADTLAISGTVDSAPATPAAQAYTFKGDIDLGGGNDALTISGAVKLEGAGNDPLSLVLGAGDDTLTLGVTSAVTHTEIKLGAGTNTVTLNESYATRIVLEGGTDTVNVASGKEFTGTISPTAASADSLTFGGEGTIKSGVDLGEGGDTLGFSGSVALTGTDASNPLVFDLGAGDDTVNFGTTGALTHTKISLGGGTNTFNVNENYAGAVELEGGATDTITVATGEEFTGAVTGTSSGDRLKFGGSGAVKGGVDLGAGGDTLEFLGSVALAGTGASNLLAFSMGDGDDIVTFGTTGAATHIEISLGAGTNTFNIDENYAAAIELEGEAIDTINVASGREFSGSVTGSDSADTMMLLGPDPDDNPSAGVIKSDDIALGAGNDSFTLGGTLTIGASASERLSISLGAGDDTATYSGTGGATFSEIDVGGGANTLAITAGGGADNLILTGEGSARGSVDLGGGNDVLTISGAISLAGTDAQNLLSLALGAGDDTLTFSATGAVAHTEIKPGAGANTINLNENYGGAVALGSDDAGVTDTFNVAKEFSGSVTGSASANTMILTGAGSITSDGIDLGGGDDSFTLGGTLTAGSSTGDLSVSLGAGDDTAIYLTTRGATFSEIDVGGGANTLTIEANTAADDLEIKGSGSIKGDINLGGGNDTLAISGSVDLAGTSADTLTFDLGVGDDAVTFESTGTVADTEIKLGAGTNTVTLKESYAGDIVLGGGATDTLNVDSGKEFTGTLTATALVDTLTIGGAGSLKSDIDLLAGNDDLEIGGGVKLGDPTNEVMITLGAGNDTVTITSTGAGEASNTTIDLGAGSDTVNMDESYGGGIVLGGGSGEITISQGKLFTGDVTISSGVAGAHNLTLKGRGTVKGDISLGGGGDTLTIEGRVILAGENDKLLSISLGDGGDIVNYDSTGVASNAEMRLGSGANTFNLTESYGAGVVLGGGTDTVDIASGKEFTGSITATADLDTLTLRGEGTVKSGIDLLAGNDVLTISEAVALAGAGSGNLLSLSLGAGDDMVTFGSTGAVTHAEISLGTGENTFTITESYAGGVVLGGGTDTLDIASGKELTGTVTASASDEDLTIKGEGILKSGFDLGAGEDSLTISGSLGLAGASRANPISLSMGADDDTVVFGAEGDVTHAEISLGAGENTLTITESYAGGVALGGGTDTVDIASGREFTGGVTASASNDNLTFVGEGTVKSGDFNLGAGGDILTVSGTVALAGTSNDRMTISLGAGNDTFTFESSGSGRVTDTEIDLGAGENSVKINGAGVNYTGGIVLAGGTDTVSVEAGAKVAGAVTGGDLGDTLTITSPDNLAGTLEGSVNLGGVNLGGGADTLTISGPVILAGTSGTELLSISMGEGDDTVFFRSTGAVTHTEIKLGAGSNSMSIEGGYAGAIVLEGGVQDTLSISQGVAVTTGGSVTGGDSAETLMINGGGTLSGDIELGKGNDTLTISGAVILEGTSSDMLTLDLGVDNLDPGESDDDVVTFSSTGDVTHTSLKTGEGDDTLNLETAGFAGSIDLGAGQNTLSLKADYSASYTVTGSDTINIDASATMTGNIEGDGGSNHFTLEGGGKFVGSVTLEADDDTFIFDLLDNDAFTGDHKIDLGGRKLEDDGGIGNTLIIRQDFFGNYVPRPGDNIQVLAGKRFAGAFMPDLKEAQDIEISAGGTVAGPGLDFTGEVRNDIVTIGGSVTLTGPADQAGGQFAIKTGGGDDTVNFESEGDSSLIDIQPGKDFARGNAINIKENFEGALTLHEETDAQASSPKNTMTISKEAAFSGQINWTPAPDILEVVVEAEADGTSPGNLETLVSAGAGDDMFTLSGTGEMRRTGATGAGVVMGDGDDTVIVRGSVSMHEDIDMGAGKDTVRIEGEAALGLVEISTGGDDDTIIYSSATEEDSSGIDIVPGGGTNMVEIGESYSGSVTLHDGKAPPPENETVTDTVKISSGKTMGGDVRGAASADALRIEAESGGIMGGNVRLGDGNDTLELAGAGRFNGDAAEISVGAGDDTLTFGGSLQLRGGSADQPFIIPGGAGNDTMSYLIGKHTDLEALDELKFVQLHPGDGENTVHIGRNNQTNDGCEICADYSGGIHLAAKGAPARDTVNVSLDSEMSGGIVGSRLGDSLELVIDGTMTGGIDLGEEGDALALSGAGALRGGVSTGAGADVVTIGGTLKVGGRNLLEEVRIQTGAGNDTINFSSTQTIGLFVRIEPGAGENRINIRESYEGAISLAGQRDTLSVDSGKSLGGSVEGSSQGDVIDIFIAGATTATPPGGGNPVEEMPAGRTAGVMETLRGNDTLEVSGDGILAGAIDMGDGEDTLRIGVNKADGSPSMLAAGELPDPSSNTPGSPLLVSMGPGNDTVVFMSQSGSSDSATIGLGGGQNRITLSESYAGIVGLDGGSDTIRLAAGKEMTGAFSGSSQADTVEVVLEAGSALSGGGSQTGDGNDAIVISGSGTLSGSVDARAGDDTVTIRLAAAQPGDVILEETARILTGAGSDTVNFSGTGEVMASAEIGLGAGENTLNINESYAGTYRITNPGAVSGETGALAGFDTLRIAAGKVMSGVIAGAEGNEAITLSGEGVLEATFALGGGSSFINFAMTGDPASLARAQVQGGLGSNTFTVMESFSGTYRTTPGAGGSDTIMVESGRTMGGSVVGSAFADTVTLKGDGAFSATLETGAGDDTINYELAGELTGARSIDSGPGSDTFNVKVDFPGTYLVGSSDISLGERDMVVVSKDVRFTGGIGGTGGGDAVVVGGEGGFGWTCQANAGGECTGAGGNPAEDPAQWVRVGAGGISLGAGDDSIVINQGSSAFFKRPGGPNGNVRIQGGAVFDGGAGDDTIAYNYAARESLEDEDNINVEIRPGAGENTIELSIDYWGAVILEGGSDTLKIGSGYALKDKTRIMGSDEGESLIIDGADSTGTRERHGMLEGDVDMGGGNDTIELRIATRSPTLAMGAGDDEIVIDQLDCDFCRRGQNREGASLTLSPGAGADMIRLRSNFRGAVSLTGRDGGAGQDTLEIAAGAAMSGSVSGTDLIDRIVVSGGGVMSGGIDTGSGNDAVSVSGSASLAAAARISTGAGDDEFIYASSSPSDPGATVNQGIGSNTVRIREDFAGKYEIGIGKAQRDGITVDVSGQDAMSIELGKAMRGNVAGTPVGDTFELSGAGAMEGSVDLGDGDDTITVRMSGGMSGSIDAGPGNDTINYSGIGAFTGNISAGAGENRININEDLELPEGGYVIKGSDTIFVAEGKSLTGAAGVEIRGVSDSSSETLTLMGGGAIKVTINLGGGDDTLRISMDQGGEIGEVDLGAGKNTLVIDTDYSEEYVLTGSDTISVLERKIFTQNISGTGSGDTLTIEGAGLLASKIDLKGGDDTFTYRMDAPHLFTGSFTAGPGANRVFLEADYGQDYLIAPGATDTLSIAQGVEMRGQVTLSDPDSISGFAVTLLGAGTMHGNVVTGSGPDTVAIEGSLALFEFSEISTGAGDDDIRHASLGASAGSAIKPGAGVNTVRLEESYAGRLALGGGVDTLEISSGKLMTGEISGTALGDTLTISGDGELQGKVSLGDGDDKVTYSSGSPGAGVSIELGAGSNSIRIKSDFAGTVTLASQGVLDTGGAGDTDTLVIERGVAMTGRIVGSAAAGLVNIEGEGRFEGEMDVSGGNHTIHLAAPGMCGTIRGSGGRNTVQVLEDYCAEGSGGKYVTGEEANDVIHVQSGKRMRADVVMSSHAVVTIDGAGGFEGSVMASAGDNTVHYNATGASSGEVHLGSGENQVNVNESLAAVRASGGSDTVRIQAGKTLSEVGVTGEDMAANVTLVGAGSLSGISTRRGDDRILYALADSGDLQSASISLGGGSNSIRFTQHFQSAFRLSGGSNLIEVGAGKTFTMEVSPATGAEHLPDSLTLAGQGSALGRIETGGGDDTITLSSRFTPQGDSGGVFGGPGQDRLVVSGVSASFSVDQVGEIERIDLNGESSLQMSPSGGSQAFGLRGDVLRLGEGSRFLPGGNLLVNSNIVAERAQIDLVHVGGGSLEIRGTYAPRIWNEIKAPLLDGDVVGTVVFRDGRMDFANAQTFYTVYVPKASARALPAAGTELAAPAIRVLDASSFDLAGGRVSDILQEDLVYQLYDERTDTYTRMRPRYSDEGVFLTVTNEPGQGILAQRRDCEIGMQWELVAGTLSRVFSGKPVSSAPRARDEDSAAADFDYSAFEEDFSSCGGNVTYSQKGTVLDTQVGLFGVDLSSDQHVSMTLRPSFISMELKRDNRVGRRDVEIKTSGYSLGLLSEYHRDSGLFASWEIKMGSFSLRQVDGRHVVEESARSLGLLASAGARLGSRVGLFSVVPNLKFTSSSLKAGGSLAASASNQQVSAGVFLERVSGLDSASRMRFDGDVIKQSSSTTLHTGASGNELPDSLLKFGFESVSVVRGLNFLAGAEHVRTLSGGDYSMTTIKIGLETSW